MVGLDAHFLLTSGADVGSVNRCDIFIAAERGSFEVLGLLLDMGLEGFYEATDLLGSSFEGGADIVAAVEVALMSEWWDVVEFLVCTQEIVSMLGEEYAPASANKSKQEKA
ncbi:hypothetical protein HK104_004170 [Borealophlyctis nickersoniae]|nr:hypothetical protein HK104_004170 [Borealophlyctis nickersoniae]